MNGVVRLLGWTATCVTVIGCDSPTCASGGRPAVRAHIRDAITGAPLAYRATLILRDGAYVDSVPYPNTVLDSATIGYIDAGDQRTGTYSVTVRRPGSKVWTANRVRIERKACGGLDTQELPVRLHPVDPPG